MTTGLRRGEACILHWSRVDLDAGEIDIRLRKGVGTEKDTKTHQMRRIALDTETVALLQEQWRDRLAGRETTCTSLRASADGAHQTVFAAQHVEPVSAHG
ncbi:MAG: tyrosine-type recombinase/integrase [Pseudonocardiaceae bacterium]